MLNFFDAADATKKIQPLANSASIAKLSDVKCLFMSFSPSSHNTVLFINVKFELNSQ
jgi:hypothetical protein